MFKKAQAATEYLIILAVVIIIALIVIGVMGGIPGLGTSGRSRVSESYWAEQTVGVESYAVDGAGNFRITFRNNARNSITLTDVKMSAGAGGTMGLWTGITQVIPSGSTATIASTTDIAGADLCLLGRSYAYTFNYTYTDSTSGATNIIAGNGGTIKLEGTCASSA